jgi:hypothetical protein
MDARQAKRPPLLRWLREGDSGDGFAVGFDGQIWPISCVEHLAAGEMVKVWENRGYNLCRPAVLFEPDLRPRHPQSAGGSTMNEMLFEFEDLVTTVKAIDGQVLIEIKRNGELFVTQWVDPLSADRFANYITDMATLALHQQGKI